MRKPEIEIVHEDEDVIVINKPSGVSVTADRSGDVELADLLAERLGGEAAGQVRLVHRLDKDASGVMILARNAEAQSKLTSYFERRLVRKTYLALVTGVVRHREGRIDAALARSHKNPMLMCIDRRGGKEAVTEWKLLANFGMVSLLAVYPLTGRTHQIRAHLARIGLPLAIDPLYGSKRPLFLSEFKADYRLGKSGTEIPLINRLTLHAYQIELPQPQPNRPDCFVAGLDNRFTATLKMLTKHNPKAIDAFLNADDFSRIMNAQLLR